MVWRLFVHNGMLASQMAAEMLQSVAPDAEIRDYRDLDVAPVWLDGVPTLIWDDDIGTHLRGTQVLNFLEELRLDNQANRAPAPVVYNPPPPHPREAKFPEPIDDRGPISDANMQQLMQSRRVNIQAR